MLETASKLQDALAVLNAAPGNFLILLPDAPRFTIVGATDSYLKASLARRESIQGKGVFEAFPDNPDNPYATGVQMLNASLNQVLIHKKEHRMAEQRYDVFCSEKGSFAFKVWLPRNIPVINASGEVQYIIHSVEDVTEKALSRMEAQENRQELKLSNERFELLAKATQDAIWDWDLLTDELWWNEGFRDLFHYQESEIEPGVESWFNRVHPDDRDWVVASIHQVIDHGSKNWSAEYRFRRADGSYAVVFDRGYAIHDEKGAPVRMLGSMTDITDRKKYEEGIRRSEAELQKRVEDRTAELEQSRQALEIQSTLTNSILEASLNGIFALQAVRDNEGKVVDFRYLFVNHVFAQTMGISSEQVVGRTMKELYPENWETGFFQRVAEVLETGRFFREEVHYRNRSIDCWFDYSVTRMHEEAVVVTFKDISEQKEALEEVRQQRELLNTVVSHATTGLLYAQSIRDQDGAIADFRIVQSNDMAAEICGFSRREELMAMTIEELHRRNQSEEVTPIYKEVVETGRPHTFTYYMPSTERWYSISVVKVEDGFLTVCSDISQTKSLQIQLERSVEELKRSNANLEEFAYAASHDLKEPIRKIHFFSERIRGTLADRMSPEEKRYFERMEMASSRMATLIDDLLSYSQITIKPRHLEEVQLNKLIDGVVDDLDLEIEQKGAVVEVEPLFTFRGHLRQLQQAFQNLIGNSLKYSRPDVPPRIHITSSKVLGKDTGLDLPPEKKQKMYHQLTFTDNGIGFDQSDAERIFNVFTRLHGLSEYRGTGIGLSIVRKVIENHDGFIQAEGRPGEGATFRIYLPAKGE